MALITLVYSLGKIKVDFFYTLSPAAPPSRENHFHCFDVKTFSYVYKPCTAFEEMTRFSLIFAINMNIFHCEYFYSTSF